MLCIVPARNDISMSKKTCLSMATADKILCFRLPPQQHFVSTSPLVFSSQTIKSAQKRKRTALALRQAICITWKERSVKADSANSLANSLFSQRYLGVLTRRSARRTVILPCGAAPRYILNAIVHVSGLTLPVAEDEDLHLVSPCSPTPG
jgi:hypothetical protein